MEFRKNSRIFVAGHKGLVGSAILRLLNNEGYTNILTADRQALDLREQSAVDHWFQVNKPEYVFLVAGTVGGIMANSTRPAEFLYDNIMIHANVIHASYLHSVKKLLYLGSSCIYPREAQQPIDESQLLQGPLEPTNEAYALAKISGIKMCSTYRAQYGCNFISAMPTNLYGPGDNFDLHSSHVLPALMRKFYDASHSGSQVVEVWGTGAPLREFLHVDDLAEACVYLMNHYDDADHINVGTGTEVSIAELAELIRLVVSPGTEIRFDRTKPDGTPRKLLNVAKIQDLGWNHKISLEVGIEMTYKWFLSQIGHGLELRGHRNV
jgi:GDP-L-fucose synthase